MVTINCSKAYYNIWRLARVGAYSAITANEGYCRFSVPDSGDNHQCTREPVEVIDDYGFCKQHAKIIQRKLKEE